MLAALLSVEDYLRTIYEPDREYVDGALVERNVGEIDHGRVQYALAWYFRGLEKQLNLFGLTETRLQVKANRFRVPDLLVMRGGRPSGRVVTQPPFLCVEILSPEDRLSEIQGRVDDYLAMGVEYVWVIDPATMHCYTFTASGIEHNKDGIVRTQNPDITANVKELLD